MILDGRVGVIDRVTVWSGVKAVANGIVTKTIETAAILHGRRKKGVVDEEEEHDGRTFMMPIVL